MTTWQAAEARCQFNEVVDAATSGKPQIVGCRDGREVVVVSKEHFERTRPNLKTFLLTQGYAGEDEDEFDRAMKEVRARGTCLGPRTVGT
ncbi:type II toxin-antitoxin system prevent-host-death family antitoxin [Pseudoroseomonas ludipueritiae]|uniref:Antitoxin n=1 Tax=Pseudoroseomonas ludipueritiae TaxID=198093 RepID=A0ABR7RCS5_9PROT|nr:type II toxin-antitoxin system prevent-host-death family antitoxin [Pseudoroseomonas ludipueritiae]MBC9179483.1 type II toxin-antitoxin system Phd/YefM family antitoxin [Pseudoroseomonas ludipueritiae]